MRLKPAMLQNAGEPLARNLCQSRFARSAARVAKSAVSTSTSSVAVAGEVVDDCARWLDELIEVDNANPSKRISVDCFAFIIQRIDGMEAFCISRNSRRPSGFRNTFAGYEGRGEGGSDPFFLPSRGPAPGCSSTCAPLQYKFTIGEVKGKKRGTRNALLHASFSPRSLQGSGKALRADCMRWVTRRASGTSTGKRACDAGKARVLCRGFF